MLLTGRCQFWSFSEGVNGKGKPWLRVTFATDDALLPFFAEDKNLAVLSELVKSLQRLDEIEVTLSVFVYDGKVGLRLCGISM